MAKKKKIVTPEDIIESIRDKQTEIDDLLLDLEESITSQVDEDVNEDEEEEYLYFRCLDLTRHPLIHKQWSYGKIHRRYITWHHYRWLNVYLFFNTYQSKTILQKT